MNRVENRARRSSLMTTLSVCIVFQVDLLSQVNILRFDTWSSSVCVFYFFYLLDRSWPWGLSHAAVCPSSPPVSSNQSWSSRSILWATSSMCWCDPPLLSAFCIGSVQQPWNHQTFSGLQKYSRPIFIFSFLIFDVSAPNVGVLGGFYVTDRHKLKNNAL